MSIYQQQEIYECDRQAVEQGCSLYTLMETAGKALFANVKDLLNKKMRIMILAGRGNNGGDGIVLARYFKQHEYHVDLTFPCGEPKTEVAQEHLTYFLNQGFVINQFDGREDYDVIIDCLLGIGTTLPLSEELVKIVQWSNQLNAVRIAVDLPTGTLADQGTTELAFKADYTYCLHGFKPGAFLLPASQYYGKTRVVDLGLKQTSKVTVLIEQAVSSAFPKRESGSHKGTFGTSLLVAGSDDMPGSALLAALGAIRSGTGKLVLATSALAAQIIAGRVPEATYLFNGLEKIVAGDFKEGVAAAGIGPGISDQAMAMKAVEVLVKRGIPLVLDAGALAPALDFTKLTKAGEGPLIITPHPGEFSRLINKSVIDIQANRIELTQRFATEHKMTVVLKGQYTVIAFPDGETYINPTGNSGLAKGGSGDVLTGMMVSMLATHADYRAAVKNAVYLHGRCADLWKEQFSETSMVSSDFNELLPQVLREIERA